MPAAKCGDDHKHRNDRAGKRGHIIAATDRKAEDAGHNKIIDSLPAALIEDRRDQKSHPEQTETIQEHIIDTAAIPEKRFDSGAAFRHALHRNKKRHKGKAAGGVFVDLPCFDK